MTSKSSSGLVRHADVVIVGGSAAGLAAALQFGRQRRSVIVIDDATPRNAPAAHLHGYLGFEGQAPGDLTSAGREEVRSYGGQVLDGRVVDVERVDGDGQLGFRVHVTGGHVIVARRVVLATGITDLLPKVEGLAERWGDRVIHCPFCHGYEFRDQRIVQLIDAPLGFHPAALYRQLTDRLTLVVDPDLAVDADVTDRWARARVPIIHSTATRVASAGSGEGEGDGVSVSLANGDVIDADVVAVMPRVAARVDSFASLGVSTSAHESGLGDVIVVDDAGAAAPGVYAVGNVTDPAFQVAHAAAHATRVAGAVCFDLAAEDLDRGSVPSASETEWEERYSGDDVWSGNPNGSLVAEVGELAGGRALDVGAGEGADAIWLAERGWTVTASDVSPSVLDKVRVQATERGLTIRTLCVDANEVEAFGRDTFDLVTLCYPAIPRTPDERGIESLTAAVTPGGSLVVLGHAHAALTEPIDVATQTRGFDSDAYVGIDRIADFVGGLDDWQIVVNETRTRPPGAVSAHLVDDVVFRATRVS